MYKRGLVILIIMSFAFVIFNCSNKSNNPLSPANNKTYNSGGVLGTFITTNNGLNIQMVKLDSMANFQMGPPASEVVLFPGYADEQPIHSVNISSFSIAKYDTTIAQYVVFLNAGGHDVNYHGGGNMDSITYCGIISNSPGNYSVHSGRGNYPVTFVNWYDASNYCVWLSGVTGQTWRLPTEAEWEYAAVGNNGHRIWPWGNNFYTNYCNNDYDIGVGNLDGYAYSSPVGSYANGQSPFGLFDMAGNVWQWCEDWYNNTYYSISPTNDPLCVNNSSGYKVQRGGSFGWCSSHLSVLRCASRYTPCAPSDISYINGFRPVRVP